MSSDQGRTAGQWHEADYFAALYEVAKVINSSLNLPEVLRRIVEQTATSMGAKSCALRLLSRDKKRLLFGAAWGLSDEYLGKGPVEVEKSQVDQDVLSRRPRIIQDVTTEPGWQYPGAAQREGIVSVLSVPLAMRDEVIGVIRVYSANPESFSGGEVHFLSAIANLGAIAIHNAMLFQALQRRYEARVEGLEELMASEGINEPS